jgi:hypothetical protein
VADLTTASTSVHRSRLRRLLLEKRPPGYGAEVRTLRVLGIGLAFLGLPACGGDSGSGEEESTGNQAGSPGAQDGTGGASSSPDGASGGTPAGDCSTVQEVTCEDIPATASPPFIPDGPVPTLLSEFPPPPDGAVYCGSGERYTVYLRGSLTQSEVVEYYDEALTALGQAHALSANPPGCGARLFIDDGAASCDLMALPCGGVIVDDRGGLFGAFMVVGGRQ